MSVNQETGALLNFKTVGTCGNHRQLQRSNISQRPSFLFNLTRLQTPTTTILDIIAYPENARRTMRKTEILDERNFYQRRRIKTWAYYP